MNNKYDIIVIGSGPGGYVTAIRASQLGFKTAIVEKESLGGICLNWGCIPTKALIKSAQVFEYIKHAAEYGIIVEKAEKDFPSVIKRSRDVAQKMSKGVEFLMKKNKIDVIYGEAKIKSGKKVSVMDKENKNTEYSADHIIIATGSRSRVLPNLPQDGEKIIGYRQALSLKSLPKRMVVVGSGAIGVEFAYFYHAMGTDVTIIEFQSSLVPNEDEDVSKSFKSTFEKFGINVMTNSSVESVDTTGKILKVNVKTSSGIEVIETDIVLSAVGIKNNLENLGLEDVGVSTDKDKVIVDDFYKTNVDGYYAIGDIVKTHALAHVASAEGITCVEKIKGLHVDPIDYSNIPGCTYSYPQVASVGMTEKQAKEKGFELKIGKFPFTASGKATSAGAVDGFVKVIFDAKYGELLGCHMIGDGVTELIAEAVVARKLETTGHDMLKAIHPHPTMSEAVMEAVAAAYGEVIHI